MILTCFVTFLLFHAVCALCTFGQAAIAAWFGVTIEEIFVGFGFQLFSFRFRGILVRVKLLPGPSGLKILNEEARTDDDGTEEIAPVHQSTSRPYDSLPLASRLQVILASPVIGILLGLLLLTIPSLLNAPQLVATELPGLQQISPRAVPFLGISQDATTLTGQFRFFDETFVRFWTQWNPRHWSQWGGYLGFLTTTVAVGMQSFPGLLTCLGTVLFGLSVLNLLPVGGLPGSYVVLTLLKQVPGLITDARERTISIVGVLILLCIYAFLAISDLQWLLS